MKNVSKLFVRSIALLLALIYLFGPLQAASLISEKAPQKKVLYIGYPSSAFAKGILEDMKIALEVWGSKLAERVSGGQGIEDVHVTMFEDMYFSDIYDALIGKKLDILIMNTLDFVLHENEMLMEPAFVGASEESIGYKYILLVRRDSGIDSLSQLQDRVIHIETEGVGRMPYVWLDVMLSKEGLPSYNSFFKKNIFVENGTKAVLPVFFNNVSACVTTVRAFRTLSELNPQLERELKILRTSPELLRGVVAFRIDLEQDLKNDFADALYAMHEDPDGQQILYVMREQKVIPYKDEYVENVRALIREHRKLLTGSIR